MGRRERRKAYKADRKRQKKYNFVASNVGDNGYFVKTSLRGKDYYIHPKGDKYHFYPKLEGAAVFHKEAAKILADAQHIDCEVISVNDATK